jgi:hypothetical protein
MLVVVHLLTRRLFAVPFERVRLTKIVLIVGGFAIAGELALPTAGVAGFAARAAVLAAIPVVLVLARVFSPQEIASFRRALRSG